MSIVANKVGLTNVAKQTASSFFKKAGDESFFKPSIPVPVIQAKLSVSPPNDPMEREADEMADKVMRMPQTIQRECDACDNGDEEKVQKKSLNNFIQKKESDSSSVSEGVAESIRATKGTGSPISTSSKNLMENSFGADFSSVRIHSNDNAVQLSSQLNARAFTTGSDIYFNRGEYNPESSEGKHLLAHELTHVVQQGSSHSIQRQSVPVATPTATPAPAPVPWSTRLSAAPFEIDSDTAYINLITEAIGSGTTIHPATNAAVSIDAAITAGNYTAWDATTMTINFDANFNNKAGIGSGPYGETIFKTNNGTQVYIILGPNALKSFGPEYTQMANAHEQAHARDFASQGASPHMATNTEELTIYTQGFVNYFLPLVRLDVPNCSFDFGESFDPLFERYSAANAADRTTAFTNIQTFYTGTIASSPDNLLKFRIWLQDNMNRRSATNALAVRLNTLLTPPLIRGASPATLITGCV